MSIVHDPETGKREDIERALGPYLMPEGNQVSRAFLINALAESKDVIVTECEVGRFEGAEYFGMPKRKQTQIVVHSGGYSSAFYLDGYIGTPGKATCIILPRKEVNEMKIAKWACDFCGKEYVDRSPPPREQYEMGRIDIRDGTMLLPKRVVNARHRDGYADSHAKGLDGQYCNIDCLKAKIKAILTETRGMEGGPNCCR